MSETTNQSCQIFGIAGVLTQLILGFLSFSVLIIKRYQQKPKRPWRIWALDASKQAVSQMIAHFINVAISIGLSYKLQNDACIWYAATNILDNTCGVFICVGVLRLVEHFLLTGRLEKYKSGNYYEIIDEYDQDKASQIYSSGNSQIDRQIHSLQITVVKKRIIIQYATWFIQFLLWNIIVAITKTILFYLELLINRPITIIFDFLLGWVQPYPTFQLFLVIIVIPVIMNSFAFWMQDNFLKKQQNNDLNPNKESLL